MRRVWLLFALCVLGGLAVAACDKTETTIVDPGTPGEGEPGIPAALALARNVPPVLANGEDGVDIFVTVVDADLRALSDVGVGFSTTAGSIDPFATTNANGVAQTRLTSAASFADIVATVTAVAVADTSGTPLPPQLEVLVTREPVSADVLAEARTAFWTRPAPGVAGSAQQESVSDQITVRMLGVTMTLSATPGILPADGASTSRVRANLVETTTRIPLSGEVVRFGATSGLVTGRVTTDASGTATALLTSTEGGATSSITAYYGDLLTGNTEVAFSSLALSLGAGFPTFQPDGAFVTPVLATLINAENNPVSGVTLEFTTDTGTITSPSVTGADGTASATLRTGIADASANVTVRFGELSVTETVAVEPPPAATIALSPNPATLPADEASEAVLTATVLDALGNPVIDGTLVTFAVESGSGSVVSPVRPTVAGVARGTFVAGGTPGQVTVSATVGAVSASASVTTTALPPSFLVLSASDGEILADGLASTVITATVSDALGSPVGAGNSVSFTTTRGALDDVRPTDASGMASVRLRAERFVTGTARVTASVAGIQETIDIGLVSDDPAQIVVVEVAEPRIGVRGSGALETAVVTYQVRDRFGIPVDENHAATLDFTIVPVTGAIDATVAPASATTNHNGTAVATVQAGTVSGAIELEARSGALFSAPIRIAIHGDLPDPAHFSISFERLNIAGLVFDGIRNGVTARIGDVHGNPVPDSTAAWFSAAFGLIQGSAFTDDHGEATVWEITAGPHPPIPGGDGLVEITAQTVSKAGDLITVSGNVMWSGPTIVEITSPEEGFTIPNGGAQAITYEVRDGNFNPLTAGTSISVTSNRGELGGATDVVLPDTQSSAHTMFSVILSDDDVDEDVTESVTVTVTVSSQNGNAQASITGTKN
jgi:adhesin/invasin